MNANSPSRRRTLTDAEYLEGIRARDRSTLARAITLVESRRAEDRARAQELLQTLLPDTGRSVRIGISGAPGVGKSTFIERFGKQLTAAGKRVAVLAVDPSSPESGGSILGDKTRMPELAVDPNAFIRPSPAGQTLGGVAARTREALLLCEAAGYDVVLVETVGVGQSEVEVAAMVDFFLVLLLPTSGDELQGIKKGILELCDLVVVHKSDLDARATQLALTEYQSALGYLPRRKSFWSPKAIPASGLTGEGLDIVWETIEEYRTVAAEGDHWDSIRQEQRLRWLWTAVEASLLEALHEDSEVQLERDAVERAVRDQTLTVAQAAKRIVDRFLSHSGGGAGETGGFHVD